MKQLICEMCGSTDMVKQDGVFICQTCGCKYSIDEARKMMVDGTVEVTGTVKVDNTATLDNFKNIARSAIKSRNYEEAENYSNKIIELDPKNSFAWEIKGNSAGWQSTAKNSRLGEAMNAWLNAINFASVDDLVELRYHVSVEYATLFTSMIHLRAKNFAIIQDAKNLKSTITELDNGIYIMNTLMVKGGVSFNRGPIYNNIAKELNSSAVDGYIDSKKDFGPDHSNMAKWQWNNFVGACDNCIKMLQKALDYCRDSEQGKKICKNYITIAVDVRDSCSYRNIINPLTGDDNYIKEYALADEAIKSRNKNIKKCKERLSFFEEDQIATILNEIKNDRKDIEIELAKKAYWDDHIAEKTLLEKEEAILFENIYEKEKKLKSLPISYELHTTDKKIDELIEQKSALGFFKGKEKKAIQEQIDKLEQTRNNQRSQEESEKKPIEDAITRSRSRINEIQIELNKERGQLSVSADDIFLPGAITDGKFTITPQQLYDHLAKVLPSFFDCSKLKDDSSSYDDFGHQVKIIDNGVKLYCTADDKNSPIRNIIMENTTASIASNDDKKNWAILGSYIFMSLFKDQDQNEAEKTVMNIRFNADKTYGRKDLIRFEYASKPNDLLKIGIYVNFDAMIIRPVLD